MNNYQGTIIEESLADKSVLKDVKILSTRIEKVAKKHKTPWLKQWTLHKVEIPSASASAIAKRISKAIDTTHGTWYADYKNKTHHYIIYPNKIFYIDRTKKQEYDEATRYGIQLGIPDYQLDFSPDVK